MRGDPRLLGLILVLAPAACAGQHFAWLHRSLAPVAAPDLPGIEAEIRELKEKLVPLPPLIPGGAGVRRGYHSTYTPLPKKPFWIVLDLKRSYPIDLVALVPADGPVPATKPGYGFPLRFQVDLSDDPEFVEFTTIAQEIRRPYPNPGRYPYVAAAEGHRARYLRIYAATRWQQDLRIWMIAFGEIFVISGGRNVAFGSEALPFAGLSTRNPPIWLDGNLVDHQSNLGLPAGPRLSRTHGYSSQACAVSECEKWVQVNLREPSPIDEVRLVPAHPHDSPSPGYGFPLRFRVEVSSDPTFSKPIVCASYTKEDYLNPGDNIVSVPCGGALGRHVRVIATRLHAVYEPPYPYLLALAELQVYSGDSNVAINAQVEALDQLTGERPPHIAGMYPDGPMWGPEYLVDGFSSRHELIGLSEWLSGLARRGRLERRLQELSGLRVLRLDSISTLAANLGAAFILLLSGSLLFAVIYSWRRREHQIRELRRRLARDLHDEVGSSLGSIRLTSQVAQCSSSLPEHLAQDLKEIELVACSTAESMQDIVWLLDGQRVSSGELVNQMRDVARRLLAGCDYTLNVSPAKADCRLSLDFRRNVLFAFKEALYNAVRHSGASHIRVDIDSQGRNFSFRVQDNGRGWSQEDISRGHGLNNILSRARHLKGHAAFDNDAVSGSRVSFQVPAP